MLVFREGDLCQVTISHAAQYEYPKLPEDVASFLMLGQPGFMLINLLFDRTPSHVKAC